MKNLFIGILMLFTVKLFAASPTFAGTNQFYNINTWTNGGNIYSMDGQGRYTMTNPANGSYWTMGTNGHYRGIDQYGNLREWTTNRFTIQTSVGGVSKTMQFSNNTLFVDGAIVATNGAKANFDNGAITSDGFGDLNLQQITATLLFGNVQGNVTGNLFGNATTASASTSAIYAGIATNVASGVNIYGAFSGLYLQGNPVEIDFAGDSLMKQLLYNGWKSFGPSTNSSVASAATNQPDGSIFYAVGSYSTNNFSYGVILTNQFGLAGYPVLFADPEAVPGQGMWNIWGGIPADHSTYVPQSFSGIVYKASGQTNYTSLETSTDWAYWPVSTNDLGIIYNSTTYTTNVGNSILFHGSNRGSGPAYVLVTLLGTPNSNVTAQVTHELIPGTQNAYGPPWNAVSTKGTNNVACGYWAYTNSPLLTGKPKIFYLCAGGNDTIVLGNTNGFPANVTNQISYVYSNNAAYCTVLKSWGYIVVLGTYPLNYNYWSYTNSPSSSAYSTYELIALASMVRATPNTVADLIFDLAATNAPYLPYATNYLADGTHGTSNLTRIDGIAFYNFLKGSLLIPPGLPHGTLGLNDGGFVTNLQPGSIVAGNLSTTVTNTAPLNGGNLTAGTVGAAALTQTYLTANQTITVSGDYTATGTTAISLSGPRNAQWTNAIAFVLTNQAPANGYLLTATNNGLGFYWAAPAAAVSTANLLTTNGNIGEVPANTIKIGSNSVANVGTKNIIIGANTTTPFGNGSMTVIGESANAAAAGVTAIGHNASGASGTGVVIGDSATASTGNNQVAIGASATGTAANTVIIGQGASASGANSINIGGLNAVSGTNSIQLGLSQSTFSVANSLRVNDGQNFFVDGVSNRVVFSNGFASFISNTLALTSITFPASTVNWTNTTGRNISVLIDNTAVTGTSVTINGSTVFSGLSLDVTIPNLHPGEYFSETYTVGSPTAKIKPE